MANSFEIYNAAELWQRDTSLPAIPSFSQSIDKMMGNDGFQLGTITEVIGLPGTGKTQLCLQLCASVQVPKELCGLESEALYVDTNTNFTPWRFKEIALASLTRCQKVLGTYLNITEEETMKKLHYVNAFGLQKFCAFMHRLPILIEDLPKVKLIVIDSITFPFKDGISPQQRTGLLFRQMADINKMAVQKQIAVVLTNELTTRLGLSSSTATVGALGDSWSHRCNVRLLMSMQNDVRFAVLLKSNVAANDVAKFRITQGGIRDAD